MPDHDPEARQNLQDALANLPWVQREIFKLHAVDAYSYSEIAWLLRTNERTVERQMAKAIYKLSKQMEGHPLSWWERWF
jgi:RNA polymerase sigma-70 factor (ECF subfamily)